MNLNLNQLLAITMGILSAFGATTAQLTDLFGPTAAHTILSASTLLTALISGVLVAITGQGSLIRGVANMPGVEKITVNEKANQTLAAIATDSSQSKVQPTPKAEDALTQTAGGK